MTRVLHACDMAPVRVLLLCLATLAPWVVFGAPGPRPIEITATDFARHFLSDPDALARVSRSGNLAGRGRGQPPGPAVQGWFEYDFHVGHAGWYQLMVRGAGGGAGHLHEFILDDTTRLDGRGYPGARSGAAFKAGNLWLDPGSHRLRVRRMAWQGMDPITALELVPSADRLDQRLDIRLADEAHFIDPFLRRGEPLALRLWTSGANDGDLAIEVRRADDDRLVQRLTPDLPKRTTPYVKRLEIATPEPGAYYLRYLDRGRPIAARDIRPIRFDVIDTASPAPASQAAGRVLERIDCSRREPDYVDAGGDTRVLPAVDAAGSGLRYRESGARGFRQRREGGSSWFGYRLGELDGQRAHLLRVAYPDDALRTFTVSIHEQEPLYYTLSQGVDSGGEFTPSGQLQVLELPFWPRVDGAPRLVLHNAQDGRRAACAWIEVVRPQTGPAPGPTAGGRHFGHWFEEPDRWAAVYGAETSAGSPTRAGYLAAAERWARTVRALGGDTLAVSATVYALGLYPAARYNLEVAGPYTPDLMRLLLLVAERHGLRVLVDLHPRAAELAWGGTNRLLHDLDGHTHRDVPVGRGHGARTQQPRYDASHPDNQDWLSGFVAEFLDRYGDHPALAGVGLRVAGYDNHALNNFHDLRWGYGDGTVRRFARDTGIDLTHEPTAERHRLLTGRHREAWLAWRSGVVTRVLGRLAAEVRQRRADLGFHLMVFAGPFVGERLDDAGLDPPALAAAGVTLIDAPHAYGRNSRQPRPADAILEDQRERDKLVDSTFLARLRPPGGNGAVLFPARYFELPANALPRETLGLAATTRPLQLTAHVAPAGRHHLERYALALAATDAALLLNGGVAHFVDQPQLNEFLREYRRLPALPFSEVPETGDAVTARRHGHDGAHRFYLVNRLPVEVEVQLRYAGDPGAGPTRLTLAAFALRVFDAPGTGRLAAVTARPPADFTALLARQAEWLGGFATRVAAAVNGRTILQRDVRLAADRAKAADELAAQGRHAALRAMLWQHDLQRLYRTLDQFPPGWPQDHRHAAKR